MKLELKKYSLQNLELNQAYLNKRPISIEKKLDAMKKKNMGEFQQVDYYVSNNDLPSFYMNAQSLIISENSQQIFTIKPIGFIISYSKQNIRKIHYKGEYGKWVNNFPVEKKQSIFLDLQVKIWDEKNHMLGKNAMYIIEDSFFHVKGNVKAYLFLEQNKDEIFINANEALSYNTQTKQTIEFIKDVRGKIIRSNPLEEGIQFRSQYALNDALTSKIDLKEEVRIKKGELVAKGQYCEIFLENYNKRIRYYILKNDVKVLEKVISKKNNGTVFQRYAVCEKLEGIMSEKKMILTGYPKVIQGKDIIKGNIITLYENNEVVEVDDSNSLFEVK